LLHVSSFVQRCVADCVHASSIEIAPSPAAPSCPPEPESTVDELLPPHATTRVIA
jgi:hypothetical protein